MKHEESEYVTVRDVKAIEYLLRRPPRDWIFLSCTGEQLAQGIPLTESAEHFVALICADCGEKYLILRLLDLPHFVVSAYERMAALA